ncbi:MAG: Peptidase inhibitor I78 family [Rhodobacteraceae bacterium HLUCCA12]|nr:MAG: Peptidase inhibitor I78 family [Rhodobacteraceae bacterium HLUCCA12]
MRFIALIAAGILLAGCVAPMPGPTPYPIVEPVPEREPRDPRRPRRDQDGGCVAARLQHLVGQPLPDPLPARGNIRVYRSDMSVTMEYDPTRTNIEVDPVTDRVVSVTCG